MSTFVLLIFFHTGIMADYEAVSAVTITGFSTLAQCQKEGNKTLKLTNATSKTVKFECLEVK